MINPDSWYVFFVFILLTYFLILFKIKDKRRHIAYFIFGFLFGFYFDSVSVFQNYYAYHYYFPSLLNVPLTVTIAEGCAVAITICLYEAVKGRIGSRFFTSRKSTAP